MRLMLLSAMLSDLRLEARISSDAAHAVHLVERHIGILRRVQEEIYDSYDWYHLHVSETVTLGAAQRYAAYPPSMDYEGVRTVWQKAPSGQWQVLGYGIGADELNDCDSDAGETRQTIAAWQNYLSLQSEDTNTNMFEVWPVPADATTLRFEGKRKLFPLANPVTDKSTVDGPILVLHAAAEILAANNATDAGLKLQKAQARFDRLRQRSAAPEANTRSLVLGGGAYAPSQGAQRFRVR